MIPIKDKKYMINCQGPFEYNRYMGEGVCTGEKEDFCDENGETFVYGFKIPLNDETCFFEEESIVAEFGDDGEIKENYSSDIPEDEEPPNYERMKKQWDIMFKALNDALNECGEPHTGLTLRQALKKLDESW
jgi:hypothetical protein